MASTYTLISSQVLGSGALTVTFTSIPQTYTDLILRVSARTSSTQNGAFVYFNNNSTSGLYSTTGLFNSSATAGGSTRESGRSDWFSSANYFSLPGSSNTANTFSESDLYIANYSSATLSKTSSSFNAQESNVAYTNGVTQINAIAGLYRSSSAITRIDITCQGSTGTFVTGSSFYLYGISNA